MIDMRGQWCLSCVQTVAHYRTSRGPFCSICREPTVARSTLALIALVRHVLR